MYQYGAGWVILVGHGGWEGKKGEGALRCGYSLFARGPTVKSFLWRKSTTGELRLEPFFGMLPRAINFHS